MKYRFGLPVALVAAGTLFVACGDESTSELVKAESYASGEDLPECKASNKGYFAVVPSKSEVYVCAETQKDGAKAWEWKTVGGSTSTTPAVTKFDCEAEELADKSGYKLVCNGDSLAVIKNGAKGEKGSDADVPETEPGCTVENLEDGSGVKFTCGDKSVEVKTGGSGKVPESSNGGVVSESSSSAAVTPESLKEDNTCSVTYVGLDLLVYDCGNGMGFVAEASGTGFPTWKGLSQSDRLYEESFGRRAYIEPLAVWSENSEMGTIQWEGAEVEVLDGSQTVAPSGSDILDEMPPMIESLGKNYGFKGKATLSVEKDMDFIEAMETTYPMVGLSYEFTDSKTVSADWGGFCLTYSSDMEMKILIGGDMVPMSAAVPATAGQEKTVNIPWNKFAFVAADLYPDAPSGEAFLRMIFGDTDDEIGLVYESGISKVDFAVVESLKKGTYENTFGIYEFGAYGKCSGNTMKKLKADVAALKKDSIFTDPNNGSIVYKTVTIGNQTWFAENLKVKPVSETIDTSGSVQTEKQYTCLDGADTCNVVGYTWDVAMGLHATSVSDTDEIELPVQGLCPEGWHVPSSYEWRNLMIAVSKKYADEIYGSAAGMFAPPYDEIFAANVLFSQEGWPEGNAGWNLVGFDLKPTYGEADGYWGYFWTSDSYGDDAGAAYAGTEGTYFNYIDEADELSKQESAPVRCVRTEDGVDYTMALRR